MIVHDYSADELEYFKMERKIDCDPFCMWLTESPAFSRDMGGINMSRIHKIVLIVHSKQENPSDIYVNAISFAPVNIMSGMAGLMFSK